jgi:hypothetical protein
MTYRSTVLTKSVMMLHGGTVRFSDKIEGGRSIKVWGWRHETYKELRALLLMVGIESEVKMIPFHRGDGTLRTTVRLHTKE